MSDSPKAFPRWYPNPFYPACEVLIEGTVGQAPTYKIDGVILGLVEDFKYAKYAQALNPKSGNFERMGACKDAVQAKMWVERVAGLHPLKMGDGRPPFYYRSKCKRELVNDRTDIPPVCPHCNHTFRSVIDYDRPDSCLDNVRIGSVGSK